MGKGVDVPQRSGEKKTEGPLDMRNLTFPRPSIETHHVRDLRVFERHGVSRYQPGEVRVNESLEADPFSPMERMNRVRIRPSPVQ